jgi:antirestriction protein ArdC
MSRHHSRASAGHDRTGLYDEITDKIVAELEAGRVPWVQPWGSTAVKAHLAIPKNASTARHYSGVNILILWGSVIEQGFTGQSWLTFRQALSLGGHVRKGERGITVVYADRFVPSDKKRRAAETGEEAQTIPFLKRFTVRSRSIRSRRPTGQTTQFSTTATSASASRVMTSGRHGVFRTPWEWQPNCAP